MHGFAPPRRLAGLLGPMVVAAGLVTTLAATPAHADPLAPAHRPSSAQAVSPAPADVHAAALRFRVDTGGPAMNLRSCPRLSCSTDLTVPNGAFVTVDCQTTGDRVTGHLGTSAVWDRVLSGMTFFFASDTNIRTGVDGFHPNLPRC